MTKKDYILFAEMLKQNRQAIKEAQKEGRKITLEGLSLAIERDIADIFFNDNPCFDYRKFREYIAD
ncbi:MAG: hypothetical protein LRZ94_00855 [Candidatus Pacebacteria bacterium]|nr:hypothetical protein [Candidatus Paceibacterota bacterium]